ncbi:hypothetical protein QUC31_010001 [Theobroma cacao]
MLKPRPSYGEYGVERVSRSLEEGIESSSYDGLSVAANGTLRTWETLRSGVQKLLLGIQQRFVNIVLSKALVDHKLARFSSRMVTGQLMDGLGRRGGVCELRVHVDNSLDVEH